MARNRTQSGVYSTFQIADSSKRIAFVSTRISGIDGVSLEIEKWAAVLERMEHECFYIAGQCDDRPPERSHVIAEAHFTHPTINEINRRSFGVQIRPRAMSAQIRGMTRIIKQGLYEAVAPMMKTRIRKHNIVSASRFLTQAGDT